MVRKSAVRRPAGGTRSDVRFDVPLYTQAEAARYLDLPASTLRTWTQGYERRGPGGRAGADDMIVAYLPPDRPADPSVPFIGLAEAMFLAALRQAGVPFPQVRVALGRLRERLGGVHAFASHRLRVAGAQILWEVSAEGTLDPGARRALIVLRDGEHVFREVVERYLRRVEYAGDGYACRITLPGYEVAQVVADPQINFGRPFFVATATPVAAVLSRLRAGESIGEVAEDFDLPEDQVAEAADRAELVPA